jgi:hypothetical protein
LAILLLVVVLGLGFFRGFENEDEIQRGLMKTVIVV